MAFNRPTIQDLIKRVEGDIKSGLGLVTILRRSFLGVIAKVLAGLAHTLFGYLRHIEKQAFPDTAEAEYLERWASIWGVTRKNATFAEFKLAVVGTVGVVIPANRVFRRSDGKEYTTDAELILTGTDDEISLTAVEAGEASDVQVDDVISILAPIAGLTSEATVSEIVTEPEDAEDDESLRERLMARIQLPPAGGAAHDYIAWALAVPGITRAWVGPQALGPGTVVVYIVQDDETPITPSSPKINEAFAYVDARRPVTANVSVVAPVLLPLDLTIAIKPNTTAVQAAIETELKDLIDRDAAVAGSWKGPGEIHDGKILFSRINEAISIAVGEDDHEVVSINGDTTPGDIEPDDGELVVLGDITWQTLA